MENVLSTSPGPQPDITDPIEYEQDLRLEAEAFDFDRYL